MKNISVAFCKHFFSFIILLIFNASLFAQLSGDAFTPSHFSIDNSDYCKITALGGNRPASAQGHFYKLSTSQSHYYEVPDYMPDYEPSLSTYMGLQGYPVNISSVTENNFLKNKISSNFWLPLSDE